MVSSVSQLRAVVVDDDSDVRLLVRRTLEMQGFAVFEAASGAEALLSIQENGPDVVTLDLNLPDLDGVEVCRRLRKFSEAYVIMITARVDEIDELIGLETGADDFISKPFSPRSVQARVTAVLRRHRPTPQRPTPLRRATDFLPRATATIASDAAAPRRRAGDAGPTDAARTSDTGDGTAAEAPAPQRRRASDVAPLIAGDLPTDSPADRGVGAGYGRRHTDADGHGEAPGYNESARVVRHGPLVVEVEGRAASLHGVELVLTRTEFDLLEALAGAPRRVWSRKALLTKVWSADWQTDEHLVEVHIGNLRKKLGDKGREPRFIRTVRGVGYRMAPAEAVV
jgi:DNA-binding response OmpR family regulator